MPTLDDYDLTIVNERPVRTAEAATGGTIGLLVLTRTRLVFLRILRGSTIVDHEIQRNNVSHVHTSGQADETALMEVTSADLEIAFVGTNTDLQDIADYLKANAAVRYGSRVYTANNSKQQSKTTRISNQYERGKRLKSIGGGGCAISVIVILIVAYLIPGLNVLAVIATVIGIIALLVYKFGKSEQEEATKDATVASLLNSDDKNNN